MSRASRRARVAAPGPASPPAFAHPNLPLLLLHAREGVLSRFRPILKAHGLTEQQWRILRVLMETGPLEPRQIGRTCGLSSPSLVGILARMEALELIRREPLAHDQRRQLVSPTGASRALAARMAPHIAAEYEAIAQRLGASLVSSLHRVLGDVIGKLGPGATEPADD